MAPFLFAVAKVTVFFLQPKYFDVFSKTFFIPQKRSTCVLLEKGNRVFSQFLKPECSTVGSALRSGRRGWVFESPHSDTL